MKVWFPVIRGGSGTDVYTRRLCDALRQRGIDAEITWFPSHYQLAPAFLRTLPAPPDTTIIHANSWNAFAFKRGDIPLVVTEHLNILDPVYRPYKGIAQILWHELLIRKYVAASYREASVVTAVSRYVAASLAGDAEGVTVKVIPNWIDTATFCPSEESASQDGSPFRLLFVGNLSRRKGADLLAPIMEALGPDFELHYTAPGRHREIKIAKNGNMKNLGFLARERELVDAYHKCQALLFPSRFEGFGLVALEAMACSRPVIAARSSSLPEVVEDGVTGVLCAPDDIGQFVSACRRMAEGREMRNRLGRAGRRRALTLFSENRIIPQYIKLYHQLAAR